MYRQQGGGVWSALDHFSSWVRIQKPAFSELQPLSCMWPWESSFLFLDFSFSIYKLVELVQVLTKEPWILRRISDFLSSAEMHFNRLSISWQVIHLSLVAYKLLIFYKSISRIIDSKSQKGPPNPIPLHLRQGNQGPVGLGDLPKGAQAIPWLCPLPLPYNLFWGSSCPAISSHTENSPVLLFFPLAHIINELQDYALFPNKAAISLLL